MNKALRIKNLCKKYGAENVALLLAEYFVSFPRELDNFKVFVERQYKK